MNYRFILDVVVYGTKFKWTMKFGTLSGCHMLI
jgi:hypothetical protein